MKKSEAKEISLISATKPTERQKFFLNLGPELIKNQLPLASDLLKQQITICIALLSVSLIFDKIFDETSSIKFFVILTFFIGLLASFIGLMPFDRQDVCIDSPEDIEWFHNDALRFKKICFCISGCMIVLGLLLIIIRVGILSFA